MKLNKEKLIKNLTARMKADLEWRRVSCEDIIVRQDGEELARIRGGWNDMTAKEPLPENPIYRLASMTKPVTGIAALIAVERGWFSLEDKLADHMPAFGSMKLAKLCNGICVPGEDSKVPLRIRHLLTHVNGIATVDPVGMKICENIPLASLENLKTLTDYIAAQPLAFEPESNSYYSPHCGLDVLARLIEEKSGHSFGQFLKENIFDPLSIKDFTFCPTEEQWKRMVTLHAKYGHGMFPLKVGERVFTEAPLSYESGGAGLAASLDAYDRFASMLLGEGTLDGVQIVSKETFKLYAKHYVSADTPGRAPGYSWGLGVRVIENDPWLAPETFGWSGIYGGQFFVDPTNRITAICLRSNISSNEKYKTDFEADVMSSAE